jgi:hypothetical protein
VLNFNDITEVIRHCRFHLYVDDFQIHTVGFREAAGGY